MMQILSLELEDSRHWRFYR